MRKKKIIVTLLCALTIGGSITANAHGGRTDGSGGHKDNQNKSGLGSYHYHCGGNPPHLHNNGCPYKAVASTGSGTNSDSSNNSSNKNGSTNNNNQAQIEAQKKAEEQRKVEEQKRVEAEKKAQEERIKKEKEETNKKRL